MGPLALGPSRQSRKLKSRRSGFVFWLIGWAWLLTALLSPSAQATTVLEDPVGDVYLYGTPPAGLVLPDLIAISGGYTDTELILTASFAPGTLSPGVTSTLFSFGLDLDLNEWTGTDFIRGAEQHVMFHTSLDYAFVCSKVLVFPPQCGGQIPVFRDTDFLSVTLSLGPDGLDDDGIARFGFVAGMLGANGPISDDVAFDVSSPIDRRFTVITSAVIPEPSSGLLFLYGLSGLGLIRKQVRGKRPPGSLSD